MTTLDDLGAERDRVERVYAAAAEAWRQAQATYKAAIEKIAAQRQPLLAARIESLQAELRALEAERTHGAAFRCPHCSFSSPIKAGLTNHIRRAHPDVAPPIRDRKLSPRQRQEAAIAEAADRYQAVSEADKAAPPPWACSSCGEATHAESVASPGLCLRCAEQRQHPGEDFICEECGRDTYARDAAHPWRCVRCSEARNGVEVGA